jgi:hypothetical protein
MVLASIASQTFSGLSKPKAQAVLAKTPNDSRYRRAPYGGTPIGPSGVHENYPQQEQCADQKEDSGALGGGRLPRLVEHVWQKQVGQQKSRPGTFSAATRSACRFRSSRIVPHNSPMPPRTITSTILSARITGSRLMRVSTPLESQFHQARFPPL